MKTLGFVCVSVLLFGFGAINTPAQLFARSGAPGITGLWHPTVGSGAAYNMESEGRPAQLIEFAVVGKETADGNDAVWMEFTLNTAETGSMVVKELLWLDPVKMQVKTFKAVMQVAGRPPMMLPDEMMHARDPFQFKDVRGDSVDLGTESVTTPAGTFSCKHYRSKDGSDEFWVSEKVAPFGLVKSKGQNQTTTLAKTYSDAKDKITGTPQPFNPMMMMPQNPQP